MKSKAEKQRRMELRRGTGTRSLPKPPRPKASNPEYLVAHACFDCRKSFKLVPTSDRQHHCPDCRGPAHEMGRSFKAPRRSDVKQWQKVQILYAHGFRFFSYRSYQCTPLPREFRDVEQFLLENPQHPFKVGSFRPDLLPSV